MATCRIMSTFSSLGISFKTFIFSKTVELSRQIQSKHHTICKIL